MTHDAVIKIGPVLNLERFADPQWNRPGRTMYEPGSLQLPPGKTTVPLIVDHDDTREIGTVTGFSTWDWIDGHWLVAHATVHAPPSWLRRGARASFGFSPFQHRHLNIRGTKAEVVARAIVDEVSVLSPATQPAEPLAEVLSYRPTEPKPAAREQAIYSEPTLLVRPGCGQVLGVR